MPDNAHGQKIDNAQLARGLAAWGLGRSAGAAHEHLQREFYAIASERVKEVVNARLLRQGDLRETAIQEALVAIYRSAGKYDPARGDVLGWISAIAVNCAYDQLRKTGTGPEIISLADEDEPQREPAAPPGSKPDAALLRRQILAAIRICLSRLPATGAIPYRQAVGLSIDTDDTIRQIAAELGRFGDAWAQPNEEQTRKWITRGLAKVQLCLESKGLKPSSLGDDHHE